MRDNNCGRWWASSSFPRRWSEAWIETRVGTVLWRVELPSWRLSVRIGVLEISILLQQTNFFVLSFKYLLKSFPQSDAWSTSRNRRFACFGHILLSPEVALSRGRESVELAPCMFVSGTRRLPCGVNCYCRHVFCSLL